MSSHHYLTYPLQHGTVVPIAMTLNTTKSTPRISRKNTMEVLTEESDDNDDTSDTSDYMKEVSKRKHSVFKQFSSGGAFTEGGRSIRRSEGIPIMLRGNFHSSKLSSSSAAQSQESVISDKVSKDTKCRVI